MILKLLRDHLPWVAPSAALVFVATTYFDKQSASEKVSQAPASVAYDINAEAVAGNSAMERAETAGVVTRLSMVTDSSLQSLQPEPVVAPVAQVVAAIVEPEVQEVVEVETVKPAFQTASLDESASSAAFFAEAKANLMAQESCIGDLRALSEQARVYFPAGGLTADEGGIEQARLIASLGQDCKGIQIIVEGHSDPSGDPAVNLRLSKKRAEQVIQRLGASGLDTSFFVAQGLGSERPSGIVGPESAAYYDRRVEFAVIKTGQPTVKNRFKSSPDAWASSTCVKELSNAISATNIFYAPRSVAAKQSDLDVAMELASMAQACPNVRLRVIGQHTDDLRIGEDPATGRLRAKALMTMLVAKGIESDQIIMAAPSRSMATEAMSGSRLDFDIILD